MLGHTETGEAGLEEVHVGALTPADLVAVGDFLDEAARLVPAVKRLLRSSNFEPRAKLSGGALDRLDGEMKRLPAIDAVFRRVLVVARKWLKLDEAEQGKKRLVSAYRKRDGFLRQFFRAIVSSKSLTSDEDRPIVGPAGNPVLVAVIRIAPLLPAPEPLRRAIDEARRDVAEFATAEAQVAKLASDDLRREQLVKNRTRLTFGLFVSEFGLTTSEAKAPWERVKRKESERLKKEKHDERWDRKLGADDLQRALDTTRRRGPISKPKS